MGQQQKESRQISESEAVDNVFLSVVLPAFNEAANLVDLIPELIDSLSYSDYANEEIVIVDDGSTDDTAEKCRHAAALYEEVRFVSLQSNYGQSAALAAGFEHASGDVLIPMDADGQNDPADIPRLLDRLEDGYDCVSGWRKERNDPLQKRIPSQIQTHLAMLTGPDIHDFGCTVKAYRAEVIAELSLRGEQHRYIPARLHNLGYSVTEIEVNHRERNNGDSHYGTGRIVRGFVDLVYNLFRNRYSKRPMHLFGGLGMAITSLGIAIGLYLVALKYGAGTSLNARMPALLLSVSCTLFGSGMFAMGLITELLSEIQYRDERPYRVAEVIED